MTFVGQLQYRCTNFKSNPNGSRSPCQGKVCVDPVSHADKKQIVRKYKGYWLEDEYLPGRSVATVMRFPPVH